MQQITDKVRLLAAETLAEMIDELSGRSGSESQLKPSEHSGSVTKRKSGSDRSGDTGKENDTTERMAKKASASDAVRASVKRMSLLNVPEKT